MSEAFAVTARAYRKAISRHDFPEPVLRLLDKILLYSCERGRHWAMIPRQQFFGLLIGKMSKGKTSEYLSWLERAKVIEREEVEVLAAGRRYRWTRYAMRTPEGWKVPLRVEETQTVEQVEAWLDVLDADGSQPDLIAPPASISDLLREDFAGQLPGEGQSSSSSRVESVGQASQRSASGSPGGNPVSEDGASKIIRSSESVPQRKNFVEPGLGDNPNPPPVPPEGTTCLVPCEGTLAHEVPCQGTGPAAVPPQGTRSTRFDSTPDRLIDSKKSTFRSVLESNRAGAREEEGSPAGNFREYVAERLWGAIGAHEQKGLSAEMWQRALDTIPDQLNELISFGHEKRRLNTFRKGGGFAPWLNHSARKALQEHYSGRAKV